MLRAFIDTTNVGDSRWGPQLVEEDWIQTRSQGWTLWVIHLKNPTAALADALRRTEDGAGRAQSATAGSET